GGESDVDVLSGDDGLLFRANFFGKLLAQPLHQFGNFDAQETVIKSITQIRLREARCNYQRDAFRLQTGHSLLAARSGAEIEAADDDISRIGARGELRIVIL